MDTLDVTLNAAGIWKHDAVDHDDFIYKYNSSTSHEFIHRAILQVIVETGLKIDESLKQTKLEWITKKLNNEKMDEFSLVSYIYKDAYNNILPMMEKGHEQLKRLNKKIQWMARFLLVWCLFLIFMGFRNLLS